MLGETRLEDRDGITNHIVDFFRALYTRDDWDRQPLDNLEFAAIADDSASWLEREFNEQE